MRRSGQFLILSTLILSVMSLCLFLAGCFDSGARVDRVVEESLLSARQGDLSGALARLEPLQSSNPDNPHVVEALALVYEMRGEALTSANYFLKAVSLSPEKTNRLLDAANNLLKAGRTEDAEARMAAYLERFPEDYKTWLRLGRIQQDLALNEKAADSLVRGILLSGQDTPPIYDFIRVGQLFLNKEDYPRADFYFNRALGMGENSLDVIPALLGLIESSVLQRDWLIADLFLKRLDGSFPGALEANNQAVLRRSIETRKPPAAPALRTARDSRVAPPQGGNSKTGIDDGTAPSSDNGTPQVADQPDTSTIAMAEPRKDEGKAQDSDRSPTSSPPVSEDPIDSTSSVASLAAQIPDTIDPLPSSPEAVSRASEPVFSPEPGEFLDSVALEIRAANPGEQVRYTIDGSDPTEQSTPYTQPIPLVESRLIKARSFAAGSDPSEVVLGIFDIEQRSVPPAAPPLEPSQPEVVHASEDTALGSPSAEGIDLAIALPPTDSPTDLEETPLDEGSKASLIRAYNNGNGKSTTKGDNEEKILVGVTLPTNGVSPDDPTVKDDTQKHTSMGDEVPHGADPSLLTGPRYEPPGNAPELLTSHGRQAILEGDYPKAIRFLWDSLQIDNSNAQAWFMLSHAYSKHKQYVNAESAALEAMRIAPGNSRYALQYLRVSQFSKSPARFHDELLNIYQRFPREPEIILALARSYARIKNEPSSAHAMYARFLSLAPNHSKAGEVAEEMKLVE